MGDSQSNFGLASMNVDPNLFLNETLNAVDDLLENAFRFFTDEASKRLEISDTESSKKLEEGTTVIRNMVVAGLDARLEMWKAYCLRHCFRVPEDLRQSEYEIAADSIVSEEILSDAVLDADLESLREKVAKAQKDSAILNEKLETLRKQIVSTTRFSLLNETVQLKDSISADSRVEELVGYATELSSNIEKLNSKLLEDKNRILSKRIRDVDAYTGIEQHECFSRANLDEIRMLIDEIKNS